MSNRLFDILRTLCEIVIPAIGTLYFALAKIWAFGDVCGDCDIPWGFNRCKPGKLQCY